MTDAPHNTTDTAHDPVTIGLVSVSDRASAGIYEDKGIPALQDWLGRALRNPITWVTRLIPDEQDGISATLRDLVDVQGCHLVRAARKDAAAAPEQRNGRGYRELFQFVKPWLADAAGQPAHADDTDDDTDDDDD